MGPPNPSGAMFTFNGTEYVMSAVTQGIKRRFQLWCNMQAMQDAEGMKELVASGEYSEEKYQENLHLTKTRVDSGWWAWDSPGSYIRRMTTDGADYLCWLCLKVHQPTITLDTVKAIAAADGGELIGKKYQEANQNPTVPSPAVAGG